MKIIFKPGTKVNELDVNLLHGLLNLASIMETELDLSSITVTSVNDGVHKVGSLHYAGKAVDIRSKIYDRLKLGKVVERFKGLYDSDFDLIWESQGKDNEHLHLEYDPGNRNR